MGRWLKKRLVNDIAENPNTPVVILQGLMDDYDSGLSLTMNPSSTPEMLDKLASMDNDYHYNIAVNPSTSLETLRFISKEHEGYDETHGREHHIYQVANMEIEDRIAAGKK